MKTLSCTFFNDLALVLLNSSSYTNFELHIFFSGFKKRASQGLTVVNGPVGQSNMNSTLDVCPGPARRETNVPLNKRS